MQSPVTFLSNFATTVRASDAIAQAALLAALKKKVAVETAIMHRIPSRGALHAKRLGLARNADAVALCLYLLVGEADGDEAGRALEVVSFHDGRFPRSDLLNDDVL